MNIGRFIDIASTTGHLCRSTRQMKSGAKVKRGDHPIESMEETRAMIDERAAFFHSDLLPFFRQIGIAE